MRTTLKKRSFPPSKSRYTRPSFKKRKFNHNENNNDSSFTQSQLISFHEQLMAIKNNRIPTTNNPFENTNNQKPKIPDTNEPNRTLKRQQQKIADNPNKKLTHKKTETRRKKQKQNPKNQRRQNQTVTKKHVQNTARTLKIADDGNKNVSVTVMTSDIDDNWENFINCTDFHSKPMTKKTVTVTPSESDLNKNGNNKLNLRNKANATESEWSNFLDNRYEDNDQRSKDWTAPKINTFWEQGPIGMVHNWWHANNCPKYVNQKQIGADGTAQSELNKAEILKKKANKIVSKDVMKAIKAQRLEKKLRDRIERGQIVKHLDENTFESFFTATAEMDGAVKRRLNMEKTAEAMERKTKIFRPKMRKIKEIATFENDDLLFFDESSSEEELESDFVQKINENDMIYARDTESKQCEHILLAQRVQIQHTQRVNGEVAVLPLDGNKKNGIVSANILSETVEDSLNEKRILKKLNVMDFVHNYKNAFFREVEELNLNVKALVDNWKVIKKHDGLSRKLRKKLGIIMARERAKK